MNHCFFMPQNWNANVRTLIIGALTLFCFIFLSPGVAAFQTAFIRASDDKVYQIHYKNPLNVENFLVQSSNGRTVPRNVIAELYLAAEILNRPPTASDIYEDNELRKLVDEEYRHTAKWKNYHALATTVGSVSAGYLVGQAATLVKIAVPSLIQSEAVKGALQALTTLTLFVGEEQVLGQAYIVTRVFVERAISKKQIFDNLLSSANAGTEISINDIKSAYNALLQSAVYVEWVILMLNEYLALPNRLGASMDFC